MPTIPQPKGPFTESGPRKKPKGCLFRGAVGAVIVCLLGLGIAGIGAWVVSKRVLGFTETQPAAIPVVRVTPRQARTIDAKTRAFKSALQRGRAATFRFTAHDLNALAASNTVGATWRGKAFVMIDGNRLFADTSIPLDRVPGLRGRYINGKVELDAHVRNGRLEVYALGITVKGKTLPSQLMAIFKGRNLAKQAQTDPKVRTALAHIASLKVENGAVVIRTK